MSVGDLHTALVVRENAEHFNFGCWYFQKCSNDANIHMYSRGVRVLNSLCYDDGMPSVVVEAASGRHESVGAKVQPHSSVIETERQWRLQEINERH